ncbi:hypothetical protein GN156_33730, partial [bacterium LRH843]|nr:hypothetical protein [bacterium LRH843]
IKTENAENFELINKADQILTEIEKALPEVASLYKKDLSAWLDINLIKEDRLIVSISFVSPENLLVLMDDGTVLLVDLETKNHSV